MAADKTKIKGLTIEIGADTKKLGDALKSVWDKCVPFGRTEKRK